MDDTKKMLRTIINGQSDMKAELLTKIDGVEKGLGKRIDGVETELSKLKSEVKTGFKKVNNRLDLIGKQVAYLEDDAPTRDEHDELVRRVTKLEHKAVAV